MASDIADDFNRLGNFSFHLDLIVAAVELRPKVRREQ